MKIADIRATPVSVPLVAPLRHANGCHWGRFVRTIVEVETDDGRVGLGELGGGGEAATAAVLGLKPYLVGRDPARLERSEEHTSELQSPYDLVCRLLLEKKKKNTTQRVIEHVNETDHVIEDT